MSYDRSYQLLDAGGAVLAAWGPDVDAIRTETNHEGTVSSTSTITGELFSSVVSGHQVSTLGRLHESRHTLKATLNYTTTSTLGAGEPSTLSGGQQTDFILPDRSRGELYPTGTVTLLFAEGGTATTVATMTYDGTSVVRMTLGGMTCTYDLANRSVAPVCN